MYNLIKIPDKTNTITHIFPSLLDQSLITIPKLVTWNSTFVQEKVQTEKHTWTSTHLYLPEKLLFGTTDIIQKLQLLFRQI